MALPILISLPQTVGGTSGGSSINARFTSDSKVGAKLDWIRYDPAGTPLDFTTYLITSFGRTDLDGRLWEIDYVVKGAPNTVLTISPSAENIFQIFDTSIDEGMPSYGTGAGALLLRWQNVLIPETGDKLIVELNVRLPLGSKTLQWYGAIRRITSTDTVSILKFRYPVIWLKGPSVTDGTYPKHIDAQRRSRVLLPTVDVPSAVLGQRNICLWPIAAANGRYEKQHPGLSHVYQWMAVCDVNNTPAASYLKAFFYGTEDADIYLKDFIAEGWWHLAGIDEGWIKLCVGHYLPFEAGGVRTDYGNEWDPVPYYTTTGIVPCADDHFWVDICKYYRERLDALGVLPPLLEAAGSKASQTFLGNSIWIGHAQSTAAKFQGQDYADQVFRTTRLMRDLMHTASRGDPTGFLHLQTYLDPTAGIVDSPDRPAEKRQHIFGKQRKLTMPELPPMFARAALLDIWPSGYTQFFRDGEVQPHGGFYQRRVPESMYVQLRDGSILTGVVGQVGPTGTVLITEPEWDLGSTFWRRWVKDTYLMQYFGDGFIGIYLDVFSGKGAKATYPVDVTEHVRNGGNYYTEQKRGLLEDIRALQARNTRYGATPDKALIFSEVVEEGLLDDLDFSQVGYLFGPTMFGPKAEEVSFPAVGAIPNVSDTARDQTPNLHQLIYGDRARSLWLMPTLSTYALITNTDWNPSGGKPGLTAAEWMAHYALLYAVRFNSGQVENLNMVHDWMVDLPGGRGDELWHEKALNRDLSEKDPQRKGSLLLNYLRRMGEAEASRQYAGQYVKLGLAERPLEVDYANSSKVTNPMVATVANFDLFGSVPARDGGTGAGDGLRWTGILPIAHLPPPIEGPWAAAYAAWDLYAVLHGMWLSPASPSPGPNERLGLVLTNWTESDAEWSATLDGALYGLGTFAAKRLDLTGAETTLATGLSGSITIGTLGTEDVVLGASVPALSVDVIVFE